VLIELARCGRRVAAVTGRLGRRDNAIAATAESFALFALSPEER
jgi:hypothetical protein